MRDKNQEYNACAPSLLSFGDIKDHILSLYYLPVKGYDMSN